MDQYKIVHWKFSCNILKRIALRFLVLKSTVILSINTFKTLYLQVTIYVSHYNVVKLFQRLLKFKTWVFLHWLVLTILMKKVTLDPSRFSFPNQNAPPIIRWQNLSLIPNLFTALIYCPFVTPFASLFGQPFKPLNNALVRKLVYS